MPPITEGPSSTEQAATASLPAPAGVGEGVGTPHGKRSRFFLISLLISSPAAMATNANISTTPITATSSISSKTYLLIAELIVAGSLLLLALNILALVIFWCYVRPLLERRTCLA